MIAMRGGITTGGVLEGKTNEIGKDISLERFLKYQRSMLEHDRQEIQKKFNFDPDQALKHLGEVEVLPTGRVRTGNYETILERMVANPRLRETQSMTSFPYLLRYGLNKELMDMYELQKPTYQEWARMTTSSGFENYYPAVFLPQRLERVERGQDYPEGQLSGFQVIIRNYKFARMISIEKELWEDDQSGLIPMRAQDVGAGASQTEEIFFYQQLYLAIVNNTFNNAALGINNQGAGGAITVGMLQKAHNALRKATDGDGNLIGVVPDTLVVDSLEELEAGQIMDSLVDPQNPAGPAATTSQQNLIYFGTVNPMKGRYTVCSTPFFQFAATTAANPTGFGIDGATPPKLIAQKRKGVIFQRRSPLKVTQEAPNSGANFSRGDMRYAAEERIGSGTGEPRFEYILN